MNFDWEKVTKSKQAYRRRLAALPIAEKLRLLDAMRERDVAIRNATPAKTWPTVALGEIAEVKLGKMLDKTKHRTGRPLPYLRNINVRWGSVDTSDLLEMNFDDDELDRFGLKDGDVLVCEGGEPGRAAVWNNSVSNIKYQKAIHRVRFKQSYEPRLLVYLLELLAKTGRLERRFTGSTIKHFTREAIVQLPVPVPPLDEQQRIVAEIEKQFTRLDAGVASLKRLQTALKRYRASVLKAACEGRLVPTEAELAREENRSYETGELLLQRILKERRERWNGTGKYKEPAGPNVTDLPSIPKGWTWATAEQLTDDNRSITYGVIKLGAAVADGVHVLRSSDVRHLRLDVQDVKRVASTIAGEYVRTFLKGGEILVTVRGTLGGVVVAPPECAGFNISREVAMLAMVESKIAKAVAIFIGSAPMQRWLMQRTKGIAYTGINIETLKQLPVPVPPLAEQTRIVAEVEWRMSVIEELEAVVSANLQRATRLRQSALQKAFTGSN
jgi:type I restriction enzyme, S subunit